MSKQVGVAGRPQHSDGIVVVQVRFKGHIVHPPPPGGDEPLHFSGLLSQCANATKLEPAPANSSAA